jgi:23S rRNA (pseudouridine1915-N3)-methyltransferase
VKEFHLIVVGRLADKNIEELERDYLKRIVSFKLFLHEVKAHSENLDLEAREVKNKIQDISKLENPFIVLLTEKGKQFESRQFSEWLFDKTPSQKIIFVIGGASGHGADIIQMSKFKLSLSEMTFPHKLARLLFVEQIYRAITIKENHPYHK